MKKSALVLIAVIVLAAGILYAVALPGGLELGGFSLGGSDRAYLRDRTIDFLEDIKFKDFDTAATYHLAETQAKRDIPALIQRIFRVKHEVLDIHDYTIMGVELDGSKKRARVRALIRYRLLGDKMVRDDQEAHRDAEMLFYWFKGPDDLWTMELESSLR